MWASEGSELGEKRNGSRNNRELSENELKTGQHRNHIQDFLGDYMIMSKEIK